jgi:hypothetical protein
MLPERTSARLDLDLGSAEGDPAPSPVLIKRIRTTADGTSCIDEICIPMAGEHGRQSVSPIVPVIGLRVRRSESLASRTFHPAPRPILGIILCGALEIEAANGDRALLTAGSVIQIEDTEGTGHITRTVEVPAVYLEIQLGDADA